MTESNLNRNYSLDHLRVLATILVICVHSSGGYVLSVLDGQKIDSNFYVGNWVDSFSRVCVPIFVMLSGYFLLDNQQKPIEFYKKRFSKILIPLIFWSVLYTIYSGLKFYYLNRSIDFNLLLDSWIKGKPYFHLWYMYMLLGLYAVSPWINLVLKNLDNQKLGLLGFGLLFISSIYVTFYGYSKENVFFAFWFIPYLGYFVVGCFFSRINRKLNSILLLLLYLVCSVTIFALTNVSIENKHSTPFYSYLNPLVVVSSLSLFLFFSLGRLSRNHFSELSVYTFGVYFVHAGILDVIGKMMFFTKIQFLDNALLGLPIKVFVTFVLSFLVVKFFRQNSLLRRFV
ncbi:MAG: hypothetical protein C4K58_07275 [Flavobacteriaceae bacterium]|nr:MAG: hypothetical protein C4K58_07275 [Flavobacteriaceae bacterium]